MHRRRTTRTAWFRSTSHRLHWCYVARAGLIHCSLTSRSTTTSLMHFTALPGRLFGRFQLTPPRVQRQCCRLPTHACDRKAPSKSSAKAQQRDSCTKQKGCYTSRACLPSAVDRLPPLPALCSEISFALTCMSGYRAWAGLEAHLDSSGADWKRGWAVQAAAWQPHLRGRSHTGEPAV